MYGELKFESSFDIVSGRIFSADYSLFGIDTTTTQLYYRLPLFSVTVVIMKLSLIHMPSKALRTTGYEIKKKG